MRFRVAVVLGSMAAAAAVMLSPAGATPVPPADVQNLPVHNQQVPYPNTLVDASPGYVLHNVHSGGFDGKDHYTVVRVSNGTAAWSDFEPSADARTVSLAGKYFVEKIGDSTSVRFFDVETHAEAGEIARSDTESLVGVGPGWILTSTPGGPYPGLHLVLHRLDGTTATLSDAAVVTLPQYFGTDGTSAWVLGGDGSPSSPLYQIDIAAGTVAVVPKPVGLSWSWVMVGPTKLFNVVGKSNGEFAITAIDRATNATSTYDLVTGLSGNQPYLMTRGTGLAVYHQVGQLDGILSRVLEQLDPHGHMSSLSPSSATGEASADVRA